MAKFLAEFLNNPKEVGAPIRCSREVGEKMAEASELENARVVVEFGPGTGIITEQIVKILKPETTFFAIEISPGMAEETRKNVPGVEVIVDNCVNVGKYLTRKGFDHCDAIICTIPWALLEEEEAEAMMEAVYTALKPGGRFVTVGLSPGKNTAGGKKLRKMLKSRFASVKASKNIWSNIVPAFYYKCIK